MKKKVIFAALAAIFLTGCGKEAVTVAGIQSDDGQPAQYIEMQEFELKEPTQEIDREKASYCVVLIPASYQESQEVPGMYIHNRSPLDSSNIYYTVSEGGQDGMVSTDLTKETYEKTLEEAYKAAGRDVDLVIESFEEIDMEGVPGYKIRSSCQLEEEKIEQLTYLILAQDTYTITYSQMSDDELMADFVISDGEIRLMREEDVSLAQKEP
mgnify:CR=1 FL=1